MSLNGLALTAEQRSKLEGACANPKSTDQVRQRARALLNLANGMRPIAVAASLGRGERWIWKVKALFVEGGVDRVLLGWARTVSAPSPSPEEQGQEGATATAVRRASPKPITVTAGPTLDLLARRLEAVARAVRAGALGDALVALGDVEERLLALRDSKGTAA